MKLVGDTEAIGYLAQGLIKVQTVTLFRTMVYSLSAETKWSSSYNVI